MGIQRGMRGYGMCDSTGGAFDAAGSFDPADAMQTGGSGMLPAVIEKALKIPGVKVDRDAVLSKAFPHIGKERLAAILDEEQGPQSVCSIEEMVAAAKRIVMSDTRKSTAISFAAGLPANPFVVIPASGADIAQYYAFALRMAQEVAYVFGRPQVFAEDGDLTSEGERDIMIYFGVMLGVAVANAGLMFIARGLGQTASRKLMQKALMQTVWYPIIKKVAAAIGTQVTKKSISNVVSKSVPIIGGVISGGLTYATFRPMGNRLVEAFARALTASDEQVDAVAEQVLDTSVEGLAESDGWEVRNRNG